MERTKKIVMILLAMTVSLPVAGADGEGYKEPATGVSFPLVARDGLVLMGAGVRKKLVFNVYAAALYVAPDGLRKRATATTKSLNKTVRSSGLKRRLLLHFVRNVSGAKVAEAFRDSLVHNMSKEDFAAEEETINEFLGRCPDIKKGQVFILSTSGSTTKINVGSTHLLTTSSRRLARGLWGSYFGERPICKTLRKNLLSRGLDIIGDQSEN